MLMREAVGYTIRELRQRKGLYGITVASLAHVSVGHLNNVEHGKKEISSELLERVASAMDTTVGDILRHAGQLMWELDRLTGDDARFDKPTVVV
jgi:transcriptional regulator with XRE-family HTH domain